MRIDTPEMANAVFTQSCNVKTTAVAVKNVSGPIYFNLDLDDIG